MDRDCYRKRSQLNLNNAIGFLEKRARRLRWIARHLPPSEMLTDDQELALWYLTEEIGNRDLIGITDPDRMQNFPL